MTACFPCLRRRWLIERLAGHIERQRTMVENLLGLEDLELISLLGGRDHEELVRAYARFSHRDAEAQREAAAEVQVALVCRCAQEYPAQLLALEAMAPAVLSVCGPAPLVNRPVPDDAVAIVGTRGATSYGCGAAARIAGDLAAAGVTVISGMAPGIDSAAHEGALAQGGATVAVLAGPPQTAYPVRKTRLYREIREHGQVISELGPAMATWRWALRARNRVIAGLAAITVVIEAPIRSGALITAWHADRCRRWIGVLPGPVGHPQSGGTNLLLAKFVAARDHVEPGRVRAVRNAQDILDLIHGEGIVEVPDRVRAALTPGESELLRRIAAGDDNVTRIEVSSLSTLAALELKGAVARGPGGGLTVLGG
ncbi:MAG TPA: DNA-processing protein DprA [Solirubrobacteraceae bacterium]|nr:DNA-processing protein DprA [Solirubrobacteraceae bacterium]